MADSTGSATRPPTTSYPASHSYPSPSVQPTYQYPPAQSQQVSEGYRGTSNPGNTTLPSINLPPIRGIDNPSQSQSPSVPSQHNATTLPPPPPMYYAQHGQTSIPHPSQAMGMTAASHMMRYPVPSGNGEPDAHLLSGGRHKKEIKRRTKSGCLTCRKRRIKCDEQHPKCRNCIKSKRDCLGYDPIFKQQQGPQQLQPALNTAQSASPSNTIAGAPNSHSSTSQAYQHPPAGVPHLPPPSALVASGVKSEPSIPTEYGAPLDPALAVGAESKYTMAFTQGVQPHASPLPTGPIEMEQLFFASGYRAPGIPPNPQPLEGPALDEIKAMYLNTFAPGLNAVLETKWYSTVGVGALLVDSDMCKFMAELIRRYNTVGQAGDFALESQCRAMETKAVWKLLSLCRAQSPTSTSFENPTPSDTDLEEVCRRLDVLETLLKKQTSPVNPLAGIKYAEALSPEKRQETQFWHMVGDFTNIDPSTAEGAARLDAILTSARNSLSRIEIRDILYSVMVIRHIGRGMVGFPDSLAARPGGEEEPVNKVVIARDFIKREANWQGTSHPVQRVCDMAVRSWSLR